MKLFASLAAVAALAGCAGQQISPEQRAAIMQYTLEQQRIQQQQADSLANTYTAPMRALPPQQPQAQPFTCTSRTVAGTTTTDCR